MTSTKHVLACQLTTPELQKHKQEVLAGLRHQILEKKEVVHGFRYSFNSNDETLDRITSFIKVEKLCCSFLKFKLEVSGNSNTLYLTITGPKGVKEFITSTIEI